MKSFTLISAAFVVQAQLVPFGDVRELLYFHAADHSTNAHHNNTVVIPSTRHLTRDTDSSLNVPETSVDPIYSSGSHQTVIDTFSTEGVPETVIDTWDIPETVIDTEGVPKTVIKTEGVPETVIDTWDIPETVIDTEGVPETIIDTISTDNVPATVIDTNSAATGNHLFRFRSAINAATPVSAKCGAKSGRCHACNDETVDGKCGYCIITKNNLPVDLSTKEELKKELAKVPEEYVKKGLICGVPAERCTEIAALVSAAGSSNTCTTLPPVDETCGGFANCGACSQGINCGKSWCRIKDAATGQAFDLTNSAFDGFLGALESEIRKKGEFCGATKDQCLELVYVAKQASLNITAHVGCPRTEIPKECADLSGKCKECKENDKCKIWGKFKEVDSQQVIDLSGSEYDEEFKQISKKNRQAGQICGLSAVRIAEIEGLTHSKATKECGAQSLLTIGVAVAASYMFAFF